jgi:hypothetical protein
VLVGPAPEGRLTNLGNAQAFVNSLYMLVGSIRNLGQTPASDRYLVQRTSLDGVSEQQLLLPEPVTALADPQAAGLWADDASGLLLWEPASVPGESPRLVWYRFDGSPAVPVYTGALAALRWVPAR